jgi:hypothetical protein
VVGEVEQKCPSRHAQGHYAVNQKARPLNCVYVGFEGPFEVYCKNCGSGPFEVSIRKVYFPKPQNIDCITVLPVLPYPLELLYWDNNARFL